MLLLSNIQHVELLKASKRFKIMAHYIICLSDKFHFLNIVKNN